MVELTQENIKQLTKLCRIRCTDEEELMLLKDLQSILQYVEQLEEVDTKEVEPCNHVIAGMSNVMRKDEVGKTLSQKDFLANAPAKFGGMIKVPPIIKQN